MIAATHIAFGLSLGILGGAPDFSLALLGGGALLPDLDQPKSALGRILFPLSIPINTYLGHRRAFHGFALWCAVTFLGLLSPPVAWIGLGALSHIFIDALNVSGVQALAPLSDKTCVLFKRGWRLYVGSREEMMLMCAFGLVAWGGGYIGTMGGLRGLLGYVTGSYQMAYNQYTGAGRTVCYIKGKLRARSGDIRQGRWLVIGKESGKMALALWDPERARIVRVPKPNELIKARLQKTERKWHSLRINGWKRIRHKAFYFDGDRWVHAEAGETVFGVVLSRREIALY